MRCKTTISYLLFSFVLSLGFGQSAFAAVVDDFETGYTLNTNINGVNGWTTQTGATGTGLAVRQVIVDPLNASNQVFEVTNRDGSINDADLKAISAIADGGTGTFSFRMFTPTIVDGIVGPDVFIGLTSGTVGSNGTANWGPVFRIDGDGDGANTTPRNLKVTVGGTTTTVGNYADNTWYTVTMNIDSLAKTSTIDISGGAFGAGTPILLDGSATIPFRNNLIGSPLQNLWVRTNGGHDDGAAGQTLLLDDFNLTVLTEPTVLRVDRLTGAMTLTHPASAAGDLEIQGYSITSTLGALDKSNWLSIADNYDVIDGNGGDGSVDTNDEWTVLTTTNDFTDLSEFQFAGTPGDGGRVIPGGSVALSQADGNGNHTWLPSSNETDLMATITYANGTTERLPIVYEGNSGNSLEVSDLDHDGDSDGDDWLIFNGNSLRNMTSMSLAQARLLGDMDSDLDSDINDFALFVADYEGVNGPGSFASLLQSVPEPSSFLLLCWGGFGVLFFRRRKR